MSDRFCWSESFVLDGDQIRYGAGTDAPFSVTQTKNICRSGCDHLIQGIGSEADLVASEVDFVEQIAGGGERRVAAQDDGVERFDQSGGRRAMEEKLIGGGADDKG